MPSTDSRAKRGGNSQRVVAGTMSLSTFAAADDAKKLQMLQDINQRVQVDDNQNDDIIQKFLNAIGWADEKPTLVADEDALEDAIRNGDRLPGTRNLYHTDAPSSNITDAKDYADQYQTGRHYSSNGMAGGGTYFAEDPFDSIDYGYGHRSAYQQKAFLNKKAKVIDWNSRQYNQMKNTFMAKYPNTWRYLQNHSRYDNQETVIAAVNGYNVLKNFSYYTVANRSATTVAKKGHHGASFGSRGGGRGSTRNPWKHN